MMFFALLLAVLFPSLTDAACTGASPTWTCTGDQVSLHNLINNNNPGTIQSGDTINISAGSWTWSGADHAAKNVQVPTYPGPLNKNLSIIGAGEGQTIITMNAADKPLGTAGMGFVLIPGNGYRIRLSGITFDQTSVTTDPSISVYACGRDSFRLDHITENGVLGRGIYVLGCPSGVANKHSGLIDHWTCNSPGGPQCVTIKGEWSGYTMTSFDYESSLGTNDLVYIEDSTCNYNPGTSDSCFDASMGANFVFRYNAVNGVNVGVHGSDSFTRGVGKVEAYRNTFNNTNANLALCLFWRSGPSILFDNACTGNFTALNSFVIYRARPQAFFDGPPPATEPNIGACDGTSTWDGNNIPSGPGAGYPCLDQTGWFFPWSSYDTTDGTPPNGGGAGSVPLARPVYLWGNTRGGASEASGISEAASVPYITNNVDYYESHGASCSGASCTTGVGVGTLANRPASCTTGVAYWATNQGSWNQAGGSQGVLYKCTATNTWTLYYTPYTYPHPLQASSSGGGGGLDLGSTTPAPSGTVEVAAPTNPPQAPQHLRLVGR